MKDDQVIFILAALTGLLRGDSPAQAVDNAQIFTEILPEWVVLEEEQNGQD